MRTLKPAWLPSPKDDLSGFPPVPQGQPFTGRFILRITGSPSRARDIHLGSCPLIPFSSRDNTPYTYCKQIITIDVVKEADKTPINGQTPRDRRRLAQQRQAVIPPHDLGVPLTKSQRSARGPGSPNLADLLRVSVLRLSQHSTHVVEDSHNRSHGLIVGLNVPKNPIDDGL